MPHDYQTTLYFYYTNGRTYEGLDTLKMVKYHVRYIFDIDTRSIHPDIRIGKVSVKYLYLNKKNNIIYNPCFLVNVKLLCCYTDN
jgi:hypothetical protein